MDEPKTVINVSGLSKDFVLPHLKSGSLKELIVHPFSSRSSSEAQSALKDISFEVRKGEFFGIVGRNGSGKSTLLKLLAGIYTPTLGEVQVQGSLVPFIELGVGFNPELSGRDNVYLNGALLGFNRQEMARMYDEIVEFAELERFMDQKLKNYSSGMQVRLAFSIAIRAESDMLLIDEVLAVGDAAFQQKCFTYFEKLKKDKRTIVFVTHDMSAVQRFCTRAMLLSKGSLIKIGTPLEIADMYTAENIQRDTPKELKNKKQETLPKVTVSLSKKAYSQKESIDIVIDYENNFTFNHYFGFSIINGGISVAELNSLENNPSSHSSTRVVAGIDLSGFNAGLYEISASVFRTSDRKMVSTTAKRVSFSIDGHDKTRGGAMRLSGAWKKLK